MQTTSEFLDALKAKRGFPSDYAIAKALCMTGSAISNYRTGRSFFDDTTAIKVADLLEIDAGYVIACAHRERAKTDAEKAVWTSMLERLGGLAAAVLLVPALLMATPEARASAGSMTPDYRSLLFSEVK